MGDYVLELKNIVKNFDNTEVLRGINLKVRQGEFVTLLGSSGCGKTTTLRIIAGLEIPDAGEVLLDGADVSEVPANKRDVNTVFQNYALFPHMNVFDNIAYGLKIRGVEKSEIKRRVFEMLDMVQLAGYEKRMPSEMSGGQKQRVAIARALINNPKVLLLDEPLGALDLQLRRQMQLELKRLQKSLGITFIYITHDQEEAINMSDRIVVMRDGKLEQEGSPDEIYDFPATSYVAKFVGNANILRGKVVEIADDCIRLENIDGLFTCKKYGCPPIGSELTIAIRGEYIEMERNIRNTCLSGVVTEKSFVGGMLRIAVKTDSGEEIVITRQGINISFEIGERVCLTWKPEHATAVKDEQDKSDDVVEISHRNGIREDGVKEGA